MINMLSLIVSLFIWAIIGHDYRVRVFNILFTVSTVIFTGELNYNKRVFHERVNSIYIEDHNVPELK